MLFVLAWLLWLYHRNDGRKDGREAVDEDEVFKENEEAYNKRASLTDCLEEVSRGAVSDSSDECLFIGSQQKHVNGSIPSAPTRRNVIDEEIISQSNAENAEQSYVSDFDDWDDGAVVYRDTDEDTPVRRAKLLAQASIKRNKGEELSFGDDRDLLISTDDEVSPVKTAKISSQPSIKRPKVILVSPDSTSDSNFEPVGSNNQHDFDLNNSTTSTSSLSLNVLNSSQNGRVRKISESKIELQPPPVTVNIGPSSESEADSVEDFEVAEAFPTENAEDTMNYRVNGGARMTVKHEPAGRIHSIVVNDPPETRPTLIRCSSPRVRAVSPRIHAESVSSSIVSMKQNVEENHVHLVVNTHPLNATSSQYEGALQNEATIQKTATVETHRVPLTEEHIVAPTAESFVESGNPAFQFDVQKSNPKDNVTVGRLQNDAKQEKEPRLLEKHTAQQTDFDAIMKRRKNYVDTMDNAGRLLGQMAHRDKKIEGGRRVLSKHWAKVKDAVRKRQYLQFKDQHKK